MFLGLLTLEQVIIRPKSENSFNSYIPLLWKVEGSHDKQFNPSASKRVYVINKEITLDSVLHVSKTSLNLLSN